MNSGLAIRSHCLQRRSDESEKRWGQRAQGWVQLVDDLIRSLQLLPKDFPLAVGHVVRHQGSWWARDGSV